MFSADSRMRNARNPYQGDTKRVLCICSAGILRSATAAQILNQEYGYNTRSVGVRQEYAMIILDQIAIEWADELVFMDIDQQRLAAKKFDLEGKPYQILNIPDNFRYMDPQLVDMIKQRYQKDNDRQPDPENG